MNHEDVDRQGYGRIVENGVRLDVIAPKGHAVICNDGGDVVYILYSKPYLEFEDFQSLAIPQETIHVEPVRFLVDLF